jgi:hypothetical protein
MISTEYAAIPIVYSRAILAVKRRDLPPAVRDPPASAGGFYWDGVPPSHKSPERKRRDLPPSHPSPQRKQGNAGCRTLHGRGFPRSRVGLGWEWSAGGVLCPSAPALP